MNSKLFIIFCLCVTHSLLASSPNVILIVVDDLGYGELGIQGTQRDIPTPHIDALARSGVRFTNGYVTAPFCSASRAGMMAGRYQTRFGYETNPIGEKNEDPKIGFPKSETTMAEYMKERGYATGCLGKWHLGGTAASHPLRHGFDEFYGFMHEGHFFVPPPYKGVTTMLRQRVLPNKAVGKWVSKDGKLIYSQHIPKSNEPAYDANNPIVRGGQPIVEESYLTDALTRESTDFIERNSDRPFFLYLSYNAVHSPLQGADAYMSRFSHIEDLQRRIFAAMLSNLDDSVGAVRHKLKELELEEDTLIFFISDNGGPTQELTSSNAPLREGKGRLYEGGIRVPYMVSWKGTIPNNKVVDESVLSLDIFATMVELGGGPIAKQKKLDGVSLLPHLIKNEALPKRDLFWRVLNKGALRKGDWKIVHTSQKMNKSWELYNLKDDISESHNLSMKNPEKLKQLVGIWERESSKMVDPAW